MGAGGIFLPTPAVQGLLAPGIAGGFLAILAIARPPKATAAISNIFRDLIVGWGRTPPFCLYI
ncbi:MAG: hypothetical protein AMJ43_09815 [Coxiella sp. DG_40]|nr:MAG: hypothetical protein AMJ43_09815 [Coxiella sp. DG_40]